MMKVAVGHSTDLDSDDAIAEALEACRETLGDLKPGAGILFAAIDHEFDVILEAIHEAYPDIQLIGCTTDGEASSAAGFEEDSLVLTLVHADEVEFRAGVVRNVSASPRESSATAVSDLVSGMSRDPRLCILTPAGLSTSVSEIVRGFRDALGEEFPLFGGAAGDQWRFEGTQEFFGTEVLQDSVPYLLLGGPLVFSFGVRSGWEPVGKRGKVTRAEGNVVHTIDGDPAILFYERYLGTLGEESVGDYPLAVFEEGDDFFLRAGAGFDAEAGTISFFADVDEGSEVQLTHATRDHVVKATQTSLDQAMAGFSGNNPALALVVSCTARKNVLGTRIGEEFQLLKNALPGVPSAGLYSYGEIAPLVKGGVPHLHNETFTCLLLGTE